MTLPCLTCLEPPESYLRLSQCRIIVCAGNCAYSQKYKPEPKSNDNAKTERPDVYLCRSGFAYPLTPTLSDHGRD